MIKIGTLTEKEMTDHIKRLAQFLGYKNSEMNKPFTWWHKVSQNEAMELLGTVESFLDNEHNMNHLLLMTMDMISKKTQIEIVINHLGYTCRMPFINIEVNRKPTLIECLFMASIEYLKHIT